jgi:dipeptidyl-peptidase-4
MQPLLRHTLTASPLLLLACHAAPPAPGELASAPKRLTLEQTMGLGDKVDFNGELPKYSWAADGAHLEFTEGEKTVWIDPATWSESEPGPREVRAAQSNETFGAALVAAGVEAERAKKVRPAKATDAGTLLTLEEERWWFAGGSARKLADASGGAIELEELSPDGAHLAFVQANDLIVVDTATGERRGLTTDGSPDVFNGILDWVYQEEVYGRGDFKGFWWSPDSKYLAFLRLDETAVHDFTVIDHIEKGHFRVKSEITRYPKVGDPNPTVTLAIADAAAPSSVRWVDFAHHAAAEPIVVRVEWAPSGHLVYMLQDRIQTWCEVHRVEPATLAANTILREQSATGWVNRPESPTWLADGTFLWLSERTGYRHVYRITTDGTLVSTLTKGEWAVGSIEQVDEAGEKLFFTATLGGAVNRNLYRVNFDGSGLKLLTGGEGSHSARWNTARTHFLDRWSTLAEPAQLVLRDAEGNLVRELGHAHPADLATYATSRWELLEIPARDGFPLDIAVLPPTELDPARTYPIWLSTYSGPDAPSVSNSWNSSTWNQFLAQNGVLVLTVNVRTASGKGQAVIDDCYKRLGLQELADLEDAVAWTCANRQGDPARVGITGGSYGGFMSALAMTHSDKFALAIAASGVYDWRMYDTIYTERYMSTPSLNPDGYAATSVIEHAADLHGHLVITHGEMDDNVHLQNAVQLVYALQKSGKDFEFVLYPQSRHGIGDRDLRNWDRRMTWERIQRVLLGSSPPLPSLE